MAALTYERQVLYTPLQRRLLAVSLAGGLTLVGAFGILTVGWIAAALLFVAVASVWLVLNPRLGLYAIMAAVLVIEGASGLAFVRPAAVIYSGIDDLIGFGPPLAPLDAAIGFVLFGALLQARNERRALRFGQFFLPIALLTVALILAWVRGVNSGGDLTIGFHELRALFYLPIVYFLTVNLVRERRQLFQLGAVIVLAILAVALGALSTHFSVVRPGEADASLDVVFQAHENALFAAIIVVLALAHTLWGRRLGPRLILGAIGFVAVAGLLVMKRRLGILALDAGVVILALTIIRHNWRLSVVILPALVVIGAVYLALYWDASGGLGQGARSFRTVVGEEPAGEDSSSSDYREIESFNVETNIRWQPLLGSGFGHSYEFVRELPDLTGFWPFQPYIPHNTIYWTWMKGGIPAFVLTLALFGYAMMRGAQVARRKMDDPLLKAWAITTAAAVPMVFLFAWGDLGLTVARTTLLFGVCLGMLVIIDRLSAPSGRGDSVAAPSAPGPSPGT